MKAQDELGAPAPSRLPSKTKSQNQDDSIMGTNNSSIVSKRSVERLYYPNEPHFFRYFVKKPQRRSPLINRGYWLRMRAIDQVVKQFLEQKSEKKKIVINLGCGYDPLPWQCFTRYPSSCDSTIFVDIDYKDLMLKKRAVVQSTLELNSMLGNVETSDGDVLFRSDQYLQLGCDLRDLKTLRKVLQAAVDIENCLVLLTAEVSITYMNVEAADALINWASSLPEARFCFLEQLLPDGLDHPFSETMMAHFDKLQTPLRAVQKYPTTTDQQKRFEALGWSSVLVQNLWKLWSDPNFVTRGDRRALDSIEPFDEWEEFALFGCHYFLLVADTGKSSPLAQAVSVQKEEPVEIVQPSSDDNGSAFNVSYAEYPKTHGRRRFAAALPLKGPSRSSERIGIYAGMGHATRVNSYDVYASDQLDTAGPDISPPQAIPSSRMCHTITDLGDVGALLVGGRTSPDHALGDCWLYHKWLNVWERVGELPHGLYRHQAVGIGNGFVLVSTGRMDSRTISADFLLWSRRTGWIKCAFGSAKVPAKSYGAVFIATNISNEMTSSATGILAGGMTEDAELQQDVWLWELSNLTNENPTIKFTRATSFKDRFLLSRFSAQVGNLNGKILVVGGIAKDLLLKMDDDICVLIHNRESFSIAPARLNRDGQVPRLLLVGSTVVVIGDSLIITGGSAVCFSFGTFWNKGCFTLAAGALPVPVKADAQQITNRTWHYMHTVESEPQPKSSKSLASVASAVHSLVNLPRVQVSSLADFSQIINTSKPVIIENLDIGPCTSKWTNEYLKSQVGPDRDVIVHEAKTAHMDFKAKNFSYTLKKFGDFLDQIEAGERLYLRSLSAEKPADLPANIATDFPSIAADFQLPPELAAVTDNTHSSPLRISGPVNMWLHYDVMANVLCQVRGSKRMLLFPPTDANRLEFEPGSSSSPINVFGRLEEQGLANTHPHEALLQPGDVLFLPPLWLHAASPTSPVSIGVNVFFRNLSQGYAAGKDTYGNRDLAAYEKGRLDIARIIKSFEHLPTDMRSFYLQRLADEFVQKAT